MTATQAKEASLKISEKLNKYNEIGSDEIIKQIADYITSGRLEENIKSHEGSRLSFAPNFLAISYQNRLRKDVVSRLTDLGYEVTEVQIDAWGTRVATTVSWNI